MLTGAHVLLYSKDPEADRAFFRDVLEFRSVDAGHGWLIFALPPAEVAVHPVDEEEDEEEAAEGGADMMGAHLYLMCTDVEGMVGRLAAKGVTCAALEKAPWGVKTTVRLPSGGSIGLYQPMHPTAT